MRRLLIVEDQYSLQEVMQTIFEDEFEVKPAGDGMEALSILNTWQPDVMIVDYSMPGINGIEFIRRACQQNRGIKTILYSACLTSQIRQEAAALPVAACVEKPFDLCELRNIVRQMVA